MEEKKRRPRITKPGQEFSLKERNENDNPNDENDREGNDQETKPWQDQNREKPFEDRKRPDEDRPAFDQERKPWQNREGGGYERKPWQNREGGGERKPWENREGGGERKPWQNREGGGERKPWENREGGGERKPWQNREGGGERKPWQNREGGGERRPWENREGGGERKPWQNREGGGERRPWENREGGGERKPWQNREGGGERKPWENREGGGERKPWQNREGGGGGYGGERKPWQNREGGSGGYGGERKPWQNREGGGGGYGGERKPWQNREGGGGGYGGERKPWQNREGGGGGGFKKPFGRKPFGKKEEFHIERKPKPELPSGVEMPLNKYLAHCGIASRRKAVEFIEQGLVTVNGEIKTEPYYRIQDGDIVVCDGQNVQIQERKVYILLNKPKGVLTTTDDDRGRPTVLDIVDPSFPERLYPVGRLDRDTTGLLLITNDGDLAAKLTHPSHHVQKQYRVGLDRPLSKADFERIEKGVDLEDGILEVNWVRYSEEQPNRDVIELEIVEGRNRVVRRLFEALGYSVRKLDRFYFAGLTKKELQRGSFRELTQREVIMLKHFTGHPTGGKKEETDLPEEDEQDDQLPEEENI